MAPRPSRRAIGLVLCLPIVGFALHAFWIGAHPTEFDGVPIRGTKAFKQHVLAALSLLKARSPHAYDTVTNYIRGFAQSRHTGMAAYENPPTSYLHDEVAWESTEAYAAGIAHESLHSKLYHEFLMRTNAWATVPDSVWTGEAVEKLCCDHQVRVLKELGASAFEIEAYAWNPSNRYWEIPEEKRDW